MQVPLLPLHLESLLVWSIHKNYNDHLAVWYSCQKLWWPMSLCIPRSQGTRKLGSPVTMDSDKLSKGSEIPFFFSEAIAHSIGWWASPFCTHAHSHSQARQAGLWLLWVRPEAKKQSSGLGQCVNSVAPAQYSSINRRTWTWNSSPRIESQVYWCSPIVLAMRR